MLDLFKFKYSDRAVDIGLLILRITFGFAMFYGHGAGKISRLFGGEEIKFADPFGLGPTASLILVVFAEGLCSILVMLGLFTRAALIPLIVTMAVAYFMVHFSDPFGRQEKVIMYGLAYIALFVTGPGRLSMDYRFFGK